jgi:predicted lipoprotein
MMKHLIKIAPLVLSLTMAGNAQAQDPSAMLIDYLVPAYQQLAATADVQIDAMETLCQTPSAENLQAARNGFAELALAYAYAEPVRFGPITQNNRLERLYFWPDRKSTGLKQVQKALVSEDESVLSVDSLKDKSVALQGLNALEYVLHGALADKLTSDANSHACRYGETIAQNMWAMADQMVVKMVADDGLISKFNAPEESATLFRTSEDVLRISFETFSQFPEIISATRLNEWGDEKPNLNVMPLRRAGLSMQLVQKDIEGLAAAFEAFTGSEKHEELLTIAFDAYRFELNNALRVSKELATNTNAEILADEALRKKIGYLRIVLNSLHEIADEQIAPELGLVLGFSSLDGD